MFLDNFCDECFAYRFENSEKNSCYGKETIYNCSDLPR